MTSQILFVVLVIAIWIVTEILFWFLCYWLAERVKIFRPIFCKLFKRHSHRYSDFEFKERRAHATCQWCGYTGPLNDKGKL